MDRHDHLDRQVNPPDRTKPQTEATTAAKATPAPANMVDMLRHLQRHAGNRAVNRLLADRWPSASHLARTSNPGQASDAVETDRPDQDAIDEHDLLEAPVESALGLAGGVEMEPPSDLEAQSGNDIDSAAEGAVSRSASVSSLQRASEQQPEQPSTDPYRADDSLANLRTRGPRIVQRTISGNQDLANGNMNINMVSQQDAASPLPGGSTSTGLQGSISFTPSKDLQFSNKIGIIQIVKLTETTTDDKGKDHTDNADPASLPTAYGPKLRTTEDKDKGVEGGFFTDILHNDFGNTNKDRPEGSQAAPYYEGGTPVFGFKRSDSEIQAAQITDFPSTASKTDSIDFSFESVAKGDDTMQVYGAVKWAFGVHNDKIVNETGPTFSEGESATFDSALQKHRALYTHEPVTFYFDFNQDNPMAGEIDKIDEFLGYLTDFPDVSLNLEGTADTRGNAEYNVQLGLRRTNSIRNALLARGVPEARIGVESSAGATNRFAPDAKESNFRANRTVILTFIRSLAAPAAPPAPAGPVPGP